MASNNPPFSVSGRVGDYSSNDWYEIIATSAQVVNLELAATSGSPTLTLYTGADKQIASTTAGVNTASSPGENGWLDEVLQPGTYFLDVSASADSEYTLMATSGTPAVGTASSDIAGHTLTTARNIGTITGTLDTLLGSIGGTDLSDYYGFSLSSTSIVNVTLAGLTASATVNIRNSSGTVVASATGSSTSNASIIGALSTLTTGTYYIDVEGAQSSPTGYNLTVSATPAAPKAGTNLSNALAIGTLGTAEQTFSDSLTSQTPNEYYSFAINSASNLSATLSGLTANAVLTLENASGSTILTANGSDFSNADLFSQISPSGSGTPYILEVSESGTPTPYTLTLNATPIPNAAGTTEAGATLIGPLTSTPLTITDFVGSVDPNDWYSFVLTAATDVDYELSALSGDVAVGAPSMQVFNSANAEELPITNSVATANGSENYVTNQILQAGTYFVEVSNGRSGYYTDNSVPYTLTLYTGTPVVGTSAVNNAGTSLSSARDLGTLTATGSNYADWIGQGDEVDYYKIELATASVLTLQETGTPADLANPTYIALLNLAGQQITGAENPGNNGASIVDEVAAGTYYVEVNNNFGNYGGSNSTGYSLFASATSIPENAGTLISSANNIAALGTVQTFSGFVGPVETDNFYEFTLAAASVVTLNVSTDTSGINTILDNSAGTKITNFGASAGTEGSLIQPLAAGTYYIDLNDSSTPADYTLTASATSVADSAGTALTSADLIGTFGVTTIDAGSGSSTVTAPSGTSYLTSEGNNTITASTGTPTISASTGSPVIFGNSSSLNFVGGSGSATVIGGSAKNTVTGGSGKLLLFAVSTTTFTAGTGAATIIGGNGALTATLGAGGGEVFGGTGAANTLAVAAGSTGNAALVGIGSGDVLTDAGKGEDFLVAGAGAETLNASKATGSLDAFFGGSGADSMVGGSGQSFFVAGTGNETLTGGTGLSEFVFVAGSTSHVDTITNFNSGDILALFGYGGAAAGTNALAAASVANGSTTLTLSDNTQIILQGFTSLSQANLLSG